MPASSLLCAWSPAGDRSAERASGSGVNRAVGAVFLLTLFLTGCTSLPADYERMPSYVITDTDETTLGREAAEFTAAHPGHTGFYPLGSGLDAFAARMVLADAAERSLDVQYYIWHADTTGRLLAERLLRAADRGVRVRLLLDDINTKGLDPKLTLMDQHPRIEIRLFNPFLMRQARGLEAVTSFRRINRRMHNKSYTADNQVTIIGGRNVGDEYFEAGTDVNFEDLDVMAVGTVVGEVSAAFDEYWNSEQAVPLSALDTRKPDSDEAKALRRRFQRFRQSVEDSPYMRALRQSDLLKRLEQGELEFYWGRARLVYDRPGKVLDDPKDPTNQLMPQLRPLLSRAQSELTIISPYFVPGKQGVKSLQGLRERGVRVRVLTNSLAATDVSIVHSGYARYRKPLLRTGVELYEIKPSGRPRQSRKVRGIGGSSRASLHAKTFVVDRRWVFVGSLNLDPRSVELNTEIGVVLEDPAFAGAVADWFDSSVRDIAYTLRLKALAGPDGDPADPRYVQEWIAYEHGEERRYETEPQTSVWRRMGVFFMSLLPLESQI